MKRVDPWARVLVSGEKAFPVRVPDAGASTKGATKRQGSESIMKLGLLVLAWITLAPPRSPVSVTGISSRYCPQSAKIEMVIENVSDSELLTSISVDRLDNAGRWQEYSADVLGAEAYPRKVTALRLAKRQSKRLEWSPKANSNVHLLKEGKYRIVATALIDGLPPGRTWVIAHFVVRNAPRCKSLPL